MSESTFYFNPLALLSFSSFLIMMVLALVLWLRYYSDQTKYVILLFIANSIYSLFYSFEISFQTIEEISWYYHMEYFGIPFLASIYLLFAMQFSGKGKWLTGRVILGVNLIPLITMALVFTNQWHHLYYSRESMNLSGPFPVFAFVPGIWYFIHQGYTILAMLFSLFMLSLMLKNSSTIYHNQVILIILGTLFPFLGYIAYQMHLIPFGIDPVSSTFALTGIFVYIALVKYRLFDLLPIARTRLFEKTDDKVLVFDIADRLIDYNDSAGELFGFSKKDMGKSSVELLAAWPEILAYTNGKESGNIQLHLPSDGKSYSYNIQKLTLENNKHVHQGILLVLRDITELIDTVKERNYAASKLDAVIHAMPDTLFIFNHEGILTDFFAHNEDKMFLNREEIIGASLYHLFDKEEAEILMETLEQCLNSNKLITHQYAMNFPGEIRHYESRVSRLDDAHVLAIIRDISESVDMRYDLLYQSGFREILMNLASGFIHVQEDSADRVIFDSLRQVGKYTDIETCSLFRYYDNMTTIVMTHEWHMTNPDYAGTLPPVYYDVIPEWAASHQKGELMKIQNLSESLSANKLLATMVPEGSGTVLTIPMISQKNCLGFLFLHCLHSKRSWSDSEISSLKIFTGMLANLLEKITIEKSLVEARIKAEAGNRMKTAFMNNISHEIRTPLNGIIGFGEIIANNTLSNEEKNRFLSVVQESSERLISTIDDYLDISLLATGNLEPNSRVIDLPLLLEEVTAEFRDACSRKDLDIHTMVSPQITRTKLHSDPDLIRKVMGHLISNAVKFTHKGYIRILLEENNGTFSIIVEDTGIGISESAQQIIFDSFTQEDFSASRLYEGSGLGLAIVKGIVTLLQGSISLTSTRGQGSKFTICFSDLKGYDLHKI